MKYQKNTAFIWDLDGTLLDSYPVIVASLQETLEEIGIHYEKEEIHQHVIKESVSSFIEKIEKQTGVDFSTLKKRYSEISNEKALDLKLISHAKELLKQSTEMGVRHFIYTHRGKTTNVILKNNGINQYFQEVLTSQSGFARKPDPEAIHYLMEKYELAPENTYYIGDRSLDIECGVNAGIKTILYLDEKSCGAATGKEDRIVSDLLEILQVIS